MGEKTKGLLGLLLFFGVLLLFAGLRGVGDRTSEYYEPIYVCQELKVVKEIDGTKSIVGQIKNRTGMDVFIGEWEIYLNDNGNYYSKINLEPITIPAYNIYNIKITNINDVFTKARINKCIINGKSCDLKYSKDGKFFDSSSTNYKNSIYMIGFGSVFLFYAGLIILNYYRKKKTIKY